jgi:hypothetical protein
MKMFTKILLAVSMACGLAACGPDGGPSSSDADSNSAWVGDALDPVAATGTAQFVGVWKYVSLDGEISCSDGRQGALTTVSGTETFTHGARRDQVRGVDAYGCPSNCQLSGNTAICQTDTSACGELGLTVTADVYIYANGKLSELISTHFVAEDGVECLAVATAQLVAMK